MKTKVATVLTSGRPEEAVASIVAELRRGLGGERPAFTMVFASTAQPLEAVAPGLAKELGGTVMGASTAGELVQDRDAKGSVAAIAVAGDFEVRAGLGTGLAKDAEGAVRQATAELPAQIGGFPHRTSLLLIDPLAGNAEEATLLTAAALGGDARLAGGAAGDDLQMKRTTVSLGNVVASDALVVATIHSRSPFGVGVHHGHQPLSAPLRVTRAAGNVVHEIEGRPAWDVWKERTEAHARQRGLDPDRLAGDQVTGFLLQYEAGLATADQYKIRAPLSRNADGSLAFACGIPEGAVLRITESEPTRQVESARLAARQAREQMAGHPVAGAIVFDCICRNLILGSAFGDAVRGISEELGGVPLAGFETYGEIALDAGDMSGFHNTTSVVLAIPG